MSVELGEEDTTALLRSAPTAYRTRVNDVLLAALALALARWTGRDRVRLDLEGHGREDLLDGVDLTRTVGWFTTVHPVALDVPDPADLSPDRDWRALVKSVRRRCAPYPRAASASARCAPSARPRSANASAAPRTARWCSTTSASGTPAPTRRTAAWSAQNTAPSARTTTPGTPAPTRWRWSAPSSTAARLHLAPPDRRPRHRDRTPGGRGVRHRPAPPRPARKDRPVTTLRPRAPHGRPRSPPTRP
ncbi:condensation domain-containing protein [Streptomyces nogalater]